MIKIKSDKIIIGKTLFDGCIYTQDGVIMDISQKDSEAEESYDYTGMYVSPGFIDIHTHGGGGFDFLNSSADEVVKGCNFHLKHGTTSIAPTISAAEFKDMRTAVENISAAKHSPELEANIVGAHLEGPYLSAQQCGAQSPGFITEPIKADYEKLVDDFGKNIARWTYAPENDKNGEFAKFLTNKNILASAGHTNAVYDDMKTAISNGCRLVTHLYSCTSTVTRKQGFRSLGVIETAFLEDDLFVEIIADGKHLPPELIRMILKIKGCEKMVLVTDSLKIVGTDIKEGIMSNTEFIVEDGVCKLKNRSAFAGSVATTDVLLKTLVNACGCDIPTAVYMLTKTPAEVIGLSNKGMIQRGKAADIVVFNDMLEVTDVFVASKKVT